MGFFDDVDLPEDEFDEEDFDEPEWAGPPRGWLGGVVPLELLVARSERAAVVATNLTAYPTGFEFRLRVLTRRTEPAFDDAFGPGWRSRRRAGPGLPPELLRYGVEFADGGKAVSVGDGGWGTGYAMFDDDEDGGEEPAAPARPLLTHTSGGGGGRSYALGCWVWPLPPPGPLAFVCEWPALDIPETRADIDAEVLRGSAARAQRIWD